MSEYVTVEVEPTGDPEVIELVTNQTLTTEKEVYRSYDEGRLSRRCSLTAFPASA